MKTGSPAIKEKAHLPLAWLLLYTLPGIPSVYYGDEWAIEGVRTRDSDRALRPAISMENGQKLDCELTELIRQLGQIHTEHECFHGGQYQELLLTNRQYAFSRSSENSLTITAANSDDGESTLSIPVGVSAGQAVNLIDGTSIPFENGRLTLTLPGNSGAVLEIRED
mgnify:FL=1